MFKLSVPLLVLLFSLYVVFASATSPVFHPTGSCKKRIMCSIVLKRVFYCVKLVDGRIQQIEGWMGSPPCGLKAAFYHDGKCEGIHETRKFFE